MTSTVSEQTTPATGSTAGGRGEAQLVPHFIGGAFDTAAPARTGDVFNPATGQVQKRVAMATPADGDRAVVPSRFPSKHQAYHARFARHEPLQFLRGSRADDRR